MGEGVKQVRNNPTSAAELVTVSRIRSCIELSRMIPFRSSARSASNCGLTSAITSPLDFSNGGKTGKILVNEIKDTSMTIKSKGPGTSEGFRVFAFTPSMTTTLELFRKVQSSCP